MLVEALLRRFVVVGRDLQRRIRTGAFRFLCELYRLIGGVGAGTRDDFASSIDEFHGELDHAVVFLMGERGRFAGRADGDDAVDAALYLRLDERAQSRLIYCAIRGKGGDYGCVCSSVHRPILRNGLN